MPKLHYNLVVSYHSSRNLDGQIVQAIGKEIDGWVFPHCEVRDLSFWFFSEREAEKAEDVILQLFKDVETFVSKEN